MNILCYKNELSLITYAKTLYIKHWKKFCNTKIITVRKKFPKVTKHQNKQYSTMRNNQKRTINAKENTMQLNQSFLKLSRLLSFT